MSRSSELEMDPRRVLIVDDEPAVRATLGSYLEKAGYSVQSAPNGEAALRALERRPLPDLLVLDLMMPVLTGFEVIAVMRTRPEWAAIPIIVLTATPGHNAADLRVDAVLMKPFDVTDVQASIVVALASRRSRKSSR